MELRKYQEKIVKKSFKAIQKLGPGCGIVDLLATGAGKTVIGIAELDIYNGMLPERPLAWLTHREELRIQSSLRIKGSGLLIRNMADDLPSERRWYKGVVNIVSPSLRKWPPVPERPGLLIVDECHHTPAATWARLIEEWQRMGGVVIGLTATLWRMSNKQGFEQWYQKLICGPTIPELQDMGYLATPRVITPQGALADDTDAPTTSMGDYTPAWLDEEITMMLAHKPVVKTWKSKTLDFNDDRTLWFLPSVHTAYKLRESLGHDSQVLTGDTPRPLRQKMLADLRSGKLTHLISVNALGEGLDIPSVSIIACLRPTKSLVVWKQLCGRGARPKGEGGGYFTVFDYANNSQRHGPPDMEYEWSLEPRVRFSGSMPIKITGRCYTPGCEDVTLHPSHRECWNCEQPQYHECSECKVYRRWTQFKRRNLVCNICTDFEMETERERLRSTTTDELIRSKIGRRVGRH